MSKEDVQEAASELDEVEMGELNQRSKWELVYSYGYLSALLLVVIGALYAVYRFLVSGVIETNIAVSINANLGWVAEYAILGLVILFLVWTSIQILRVTGVSFWNKLFDSIASIADSYEKK
jgi:hypothetical protein